MKFYVSRSLFWFLCVAASICLVVFILYVHGNFYLILTVTICRSLQPETLKSVVDGGRIRIPILYQPIIPIIGRQVSQGPTMARGVTAKVFRNPFRLYLQPDILLLLALNAIAFAIIYGINASTSSLFSVAYPFLNETKIGLCYLAIGGGMATASSIMGRVLDWEYQTFRKRAETRITALGLTAADVTKEDFFPLEQVRRRPLLFYGLMLSFRLG